MQKPMSQQVMAHGQSVERRGGDSNPRWSFPHTAFPVLHNRPLCHLSEPLKNRGESLSA